MSAAPSVLEALEQPATMRVISIGPILRQRDALVKDKSYQRSGVGRDVGHETAHVLESGQREPMGTTLTGAS